MPVVRNTVDPLPPAGQHTVRVRLISPAGWRSAGTIEVQTTWSVTINPTTKVWELDLPAQAGYEVTGTYYRVDEPGASWEFVVPDTVGPHWLRSLLVDPVPTTSGWQLTPKMEELDDATALAGAINGQVPTWNAGTNTWVPGSVSGGVTDHGGLTGLTNDHHAIYLTQARGDARYYTEAEVDTALAGKAPTGHTHTGTYEPTGAVSTHEAAVDPHPGYTSAAELATGLAGKADTAHTHPQTDVANLTTDLATKVPTSRLVSSGTGLTGGGNLTADRTLAVAYGTTAGTALQGNDPAVTNARAPTAHATSHHGGSDPITPAGIGAATTGHTHSSYQPLDTDLTDIAALAPADGALIQRVSGVWNSQTATQVKTSLALTKADVGLALVDNTSDAIKPWPNALTVGEETFSRELAGSSTLSVISQALRLTYFTARKTETTTQVRLTSGTTAAGATPTLCRIGLYLISGADAGTLVASTANDTTLFAAASTTYTRSWSTPYAKIAGQRYAVAVLVVTTATAPTLTGNALSTALDTETVIDPRLTARINSQTDLPASFVAASTISTNVRYYGVVLP